MNAETPLQKADVNGKQPVKFEVSALDRLPIHEVKDSYADKRDAPKKIDKEKYKKLRSSS